MASMSISTFWKYLSKKQSDKLNTVIPHIRETAPS